MIDPIIMHVIRMQHKSETNKACQQEMFEPLKKKQRGKLLNENITNMWTRIEEILRWEQRQIINANQAYLELRL